MKMHLSMMKILTDFRSGFAIILLNNKFLICLMVIFPLSFLQCRNNHDKRDPVVLEWRKRFFEVAAASAKFQESESTKGNSSKIFPDDFEYLYKWSDPKENIYLTTQDDWADFKHSVKIIFYSRDEINALHGFEINSYSMDTTEILRKEIVGSDGKKYIISLVLGGIVKITTID